MKTIPMLYLKKSFSLLQIKSHPIKGCLTPLTSTRSCSAMKSAKSFCGQNTWRTAVLTVRNRSCIPNSAITSSRMSRNDVLPCISIVNPANVIKDIRLLFEKKQVRFSPVIPSGDLALSFGVLLFWFQQKDFFWSRFSKALMIEDLLPEGQESVLWCLN